MTKQQLDVLRDHPEVLAWLGLTERELEALISREDREDDEREPPPQR